jgi:hypothetical protein
MQREATQRGGCGCGMGTLQSADSLTQHLWIVMSEPPRIITPKLTQLLELMNSELIIGCIQIREKKLKNT